MRVCVCVAEFVVHTMVADPLNYGVLEGDGLEEAQHDLHLLVGFVALVAPQAMRARRDPVRADDREESSYEDFINFMLCKA